jgi:hypothetical protein
MSWAEPGETFEDLVESIARKYHESPCEDSHYCNPIHHVWETAHPDDKDYGRKRVAFVLREIGLDG